MEGDRSRSVWQGKTIRLRVVEPADWEVFDEWNQDDEMARCAYVVPFPRSREAMKRWAERTAIQESEGDAFRWVITDQAGDVVGSINTHTCDRRAGTFAFGLTVSPPYRRRGYASQAILRILRYFFEELGYQKATVNVYAFNTASIALHEGLGFQLEGRLRRMVFTRGAHADLLVFGMTPEEFVTRHGEASAAW